MSKLAKRHFWDWFLRHQHEYRELLHQPQKELNYWLRELNAHLRAYYKFFGFSLSIPDEGTARLTITVYGKAIHFKKVEAFVATAPIIPGWSIVALEEPLAVDALLDDQVRDIGIDPGECHFSFGLGGQETIVVYHPLCADNNRRAFQQLVYTAIYNMLGERSFGKHIDAIRVDNLSCADPSALHPLHKLPMHINRQIPSMSVDHKGRLQVKHG